MEEEIPQDKNILKVDNRKESDQGSDQAENSVENEATVREHDQNDKGEDVKIRESEDVNYEKQPEPAAKKVSNSLQ